MTSEIDGLCAGSRPAGNRMGIYCVLRLFTKTYKREAHHMVLFIAQSNPGRALFQLLRFLWPSGLLAHLR